MKTIQIIKAKQEEIENDIYETAIKNGLSSDNIEPVSDGVYDIEKYWNSNPRIMWILKEPYDDLDENGNPKGGGWSLYSAFDNTDAWTNRTWQPIIYICQGVVDNCHWNDLDWIHDNKEMVNRLKEIAFINLSKMPRLKQSNDGVVKDNFDRYWRDVVKRQIELYEPDVIVCGSTFWMIRDIFESDIVSKITVKKNDILIANDYRTPNITIIDTYHPNQRKKGLTRGLYVDTLIDLIQKTKR